MEKRDYFRQLLKGSRFELMPLRRKLSSGHCEAISNENDVDFANDGAAASYFYFYADGKD
jgi:methionine aminotransferase